MQYAFCRWIVLFSLTFWLAASSAFSVEKTPRTVNDISTNARLREKVLVEVTVRRRIDFDLVVGEDASGQIGLSFEGLRHDLKVGDTLVAAGRFRGRYALEGSLARLDVIEFAAPGTPEAARLIEKFGRGPASSKAPAPAAPATRSIEGRLRQLDELRDKGLVTQEEHAEQRKRILDEL